MSPNVPEAPDFQLAAIYIGWPKCGSTWLFKYLASHSMTAVPPQKTTHYFDRRHGQGRDWLASQFNTQGAGSLSCIDIGHDYVFSAEALHRIALEEPNATVIVGLRDPARWLLSEYNYVLNTGRVNVDFVTFLKAYPYALEHARYEVYLAQLFSIVGRERVQFLILEDLALDPSGYAMAIAGMLNISVTGAESTFDPTDIVNPRSAARSDLILSIARSVSTAGERLGLSKAVQIAKRSRLRGLVFRQGPSRVQMEESQNALQAYRPQLTATRTALESILGRDLGQIWDGAV